MLKKKPIEFIIFFGFFTFYYINLIKNKKHNVKDIEQKFQIGEKIKFFLNKKYKTGYILSYNKKKNTYSLETGRKHPCQNMIHNNVNEEKILII